VEPWIEIGRRWIGLQNEHGFDVGMIWSNIPSQLLKFSCKKTVSALL
jgi:hypothetical protein